MLAELKRNLALIEQQRVAFQPGFNVISGGSGSGKSLILDALAFVLGARATRTSCGLARNRTAVEALFYVDGTDEQARLRSILDDDLPGLDEGEVVLTRTLLRGGRSRATVNGRLVPVATLRDLGQRLMEVSGQHDAVTLLQPATQRDLLDAYGELEPIRDNYHRAYEAHRVVSARAKERARARGDEGKLRAEIERRMRDLEALDPEPDEIEQAENELALLEDAHAIHAIVDEAFYDLYERDEALIDRIGAVGRRLEKLPASLPGTDEVASQLDSAETALKEAAHLCRRLKETVPLDRSRRDELSERAAALRRAVRAAGRPGDDPASVLSELRLEAGRLADAEAEIASLDEERERLQTELLTLGERLSEARREAARRLAGEVERELAELGMEEARLEVELREERPGPMGLDRVEVLFRPLEATEARPLRRIASGGETARVMLALRTVIAGRGSVPTLVFDEVDAGIGGRLGAKVGEKLRGLGVRYQVLTVTHLPQVASFADHHLAVERAVEGGCAVTTVSTVEGEARVREIAQMLRGTELTERTLREAAEMVQTARGQP